MWLKRAQRRILFSIAPAPQLWCTLQIQGLKFSFSTEGEVEDKVYDAAGGQYVLYVLPQQGLLTIELSDFRTERKWIDELKVGDVKYFAIIEDKSQFCYLQFILKPEMSLFVDGNSYSQNETLELLSGEHIIQIRKKGFDTYEKTCTLKGGERMVIRLSDDSTSDKGSLSVNTSPADSKVYLDGKLLSDKPVAGQIVNAGFHVIIVEKEDYKRELRPVTIIAGEQKKIDVTLESTVGEISVWSEMPDSRILLDAKEIGRGSLEGYKTNVGSYELSVEYTPSGQSISRSFQLEPEDNILMMAEFGRFSLTPFVYSAFLPGLGQYLHGAESKGWTFFLGTLMSAGGAILANDHYQSELRSYYVMENAYSSEKDPQKLSGIRNSLNDQRNKLSLALNLRNSLAVISVSFYAINVLDVLFNESSINDLTKVEMSGTLRTASVFTYRAVWKSALIPGWGQFFDGARVPGWIYFTGFAGSVAATVLAESDFQAKLNDLDALDLAYENSTNPEDAAQLRLKRESQKAVVESAQSLRNKCFISAAAFYAVSLADAFIFHSQKKTLIGRDLSLYVGPQDLISGRAGIAANLIIRL